MGNKMPRYAFIVAASQNYLPGLIALFNSIEMYTDFRRIKLDVILLDYKLSRKFGAGYHFTVRTFLQTEGEQIEKTAIERFRVACEEGPKYDAICLLDADLFLTANVDTFFDVASKGFIVTGSNGMIIDFDAGYQKKYGIDLGVANYPYAKIHTTAPIFINHENLDWFKALYESRRIDVWDDFLYLNLLGIKMGKDRKMICMPPYAFTGIHHFFLKPEFAVFKKGGMLLSGTEECVLMCHGKWWWQGWLQDLWPTMERYFKDNDISAKGQARTRKSIELLKSEFNRYLNYGTK